MLALANGRLYNRSQIPSGFEPQFARTSSQQSVCLLQLCPCTLTTAQRGSGPQKATCDHVTSSLVRTRSHGCSFPSSLVLSSATRASGIRRNNSLPIVDRPPFDPGPCLLRQPRGLLRPTSFLLSPNAAAASVTPGRRGVWPAGSSQVRRASRTWQAGSLLRFTIALPLPLDEWRQSRDRVARGE